MFALPKMMGTPCDDSALALALADELTQLRDQLDKRTGQCLEYRALALELYEALKGAERRIEELETELEGLTTRLHDLADSRSCLLASQACESNGCNNSRSPWCAECHG